MGWTPHHSSSHSLFHTEFIDKDLFLYIPEPVQPSVGITIGLSLAAIVLLVGIIYIMRKRKFQQEDALIENYLPENNPQIRDSTV